jgi:hypothetical protein
MGHQRFVRVTAEGLLRPYGFIQRQLPELRELQGERTPHTHDMNTHLFLLKIKAQQLSPVALAAQAFDLASKLALGGLRSWVGCKRWCGPIKDVGAYFSPSWTAFQADGGRDFSVIVDGVSV